VVLRVFVGFSCGLVWRNWSSDPSEGAQNFYSDNKLDVSIAPSGDLCRPGNPHELAGDGCRTGISLRSAKVWFSGPAIQTGSGTQPVHTPFGGDVVGLVPSAFVGAICGFFGTPNEGFSRLGGYCSGFPFLSIHIFSFGPPLSIFLLAEVHYILSDFYSEFLPSMGA
jgi:hypothetical protein